MDDANYHDNIHGLDEQAIELEHAVKGIREAYEAKNLAGAEQYDRGYQRLRGQWNTVANTYPYFMVPGWAPRYTSLRTNWEVLKYLGDESLIRGGTDEQHERQIFDPTR